MSDFPNKMSLEDWREQTYAPGLQKSPERRTHFETSSGLTVEPVFPPRAQAHDMEFPGEYPYTRGVHAGMYRSRLWTMRQYAGFGDAQESNKRYRYLLDQGQTGLSVAFDLPTQMGIDSDSPRALGEVGKVGVAIDSIVDMEALFHSIPLDKVSTSMTINSTASTLLCLYLAVAEKQGVEQQHLRGTIQNDILKEYMARGTYIYPPQPSMRIITDIFSFCHAHVPRWNTISISGYHIREAGCTALQEIAYTLADGIAYVEAALRAGLSVDDFAPRLAFFFNVHNNFIEEIAKFRAARRLWAKIMRGRFNAKTPKSQMLRFHTQTAGSTLTAQQPENNIARVTMQALAAVLGGTQSLHTNSMDEALGLPTEGAVRTALRTQQIIAHESGVADSADPLAGSYMVEALTDELERKAVAIIEELDAAGGMVSAIEQGIPQRAIEDAAYRTQIAQDEGEQIVVGVNDFVSEDTAPEIMRIDPELENIQRQRTADVRAGRAADKYQQSLQALEAAAKGSDNLLPKVLECARAFATVGEIADTLRGVFGEHQEIRT